MGDTTGEKWKRYGTLEAWSREFNIPPDALQQRLAGTAWRTGRTREGDALPCYAEADVRAACADLIG